MVRVRSKKNNSYFVSSPLTCITVSAFLTQLEGRPEEGLANLGGSGGGGEVVEGVAGVEAVTVEYHELPAILTLAEAEQRNSIFGEKFSARKDVREKNDVTASLSSGKTVSGVVRLGGQEVSSR